MNACRKTGKQPTLVGGQKFLFLYCKKFTIGTNCNILCYLKLLSYETFSGYKQELHANCQAIKLRANISVRFTD